MPPLTYDGVTNYPCWIAADGIESADLSEVLDTELSAGTDLSCFTKKGGISEPNTRNMVNTEVQCDDFDKTAPGTSGGNLVIDFIMEDEDGNQTAWTTVGVKNTDGYIVLVPGDSADSARVYKVTTHDPTGGGNPKNTQQVFTQNFGVSAMNVNATITTAA